MTSNAKANPHTAFKTLPVVDVSGLGSTDVNVRHATASKLGDATREAGFLYISNHGVSPRTIARLLDRTKEYFVQPLSAKMRDYIGNSINHSGYVPEGEERFYSNTLDRKEAYDIGFDMREPEHRRPMLGPNQWPDMPGFQGDIQSYYAQVLELSNRLFRGFALALGLEEDSFTSKISRPPNQLRLIHYPFNPEVPPDGPGLGAHTDYECFTILLPTAPGLEVLNGAGEWIDVPMIEGCFVINIGDMMEVLTNGTFVATSHRVRKVAEERYSFPLFCNLDYDTLIEPLPELIDNDGPQYESLMCGDHLFAQTLQTFRYLQQRLERGEIVLPKGAKKVGSFGHKERVDP